MRPVVYREEHHVGLRGWGLFALALFLIAFTVGFVLLPVTVLAWFINVLRYRGSTIVVTSDEVRVGRRALPLAALDLSTLGRAWNPWPWRYLNPRWLGANPIWTRDSVGLTGAWDGRPVWLSVGSNHRDALVAALTAGIRHQQAPIGDATAHPRPGGWAAPSAAPAPAWYPDPWDPVGAVRWWNGATWTDQVARRTRRSR